MSIEVIQGNLLHADTWFIAHQCNCVSNRSAGIASSIFSQYPNASYPNQAQRSPGTISVHNSPGIQSINGDMYHQVAVNMYAQYYPGKPRSSDSGQQRFQWFRQCLFSITEIDNINSIGFPYGIGCGLARGNWTEYHDLLERFAEYVNFDVKLYHEFN